MSKRDISARIVAEAREWLGTPYVHQASCKGAGCDCLGLVRGVWRAVIGPEPEMPPPYSASWTDVVTVERESLMAAALRHLRPVWLAAEGGPMPDIRPGQVLLFRYRAHLPARHAGIATSRDTMIHAQENVGVVEVPLSGWWRRHLTAVFAFPRALPPSDED